MSCLYADQLDKPARTVGFEHADGVHELVEHLLADIGEGQIDLPCETRQVAESPAQLQPNLN